MLRIIQEDPLLAPFEGVINNRRDKTLKQIEQLTADGKKLSDCFNSHLFYGLHQNQTHWIFREWAPNAKKIYFLCDKNHWRVHPHFELHPIGNGNWELSIPTNTLKHTDLYKLHIIWENGQGHRLPSHAKRVIQNPYDKTFAAQVWEPQPYQWKNPKPKAHPHPLIYEAHIGMSTEYNRVATFKEFKLFVLPRIAKLGYNTIQLMAVQEHPYYGSFGYQVSNFFAVSSRFGTPEELKELIDKAHELNIRVILDIVHSHSVSNPQEGLSLFDGTDHLYFHSGQRGYHPLWKSRCFDYKKPQVLHFLLSNCKYWLEEFHFDGFRFDGVTSMLYLDHGLNRSFLSYDQYFDNQQDDDAITYLTLANLVIHQINPEAQTIAEEVSGMPGLASSFEDGGIGFDFKMQMGIPDYWIKLIEDQKDEFWHMGDLFYQLTNHRKEEKNISYAESHDQAMVGDKTIFFRLADKDIYSSMNVFSHHLSIDRAMALHKMIRLITLSTSKGGYLNFMGNEWGHPEWIDFPREGNNWSHQHARRQWSLLDNPDLRFKFLNQFDIEMISWAEKNQILDTDIRLLKCDNEQQILIFMRGDFLLAFNFSPFHSIENYRFEAPAGKYCICLNSDSTAFDGQNRIDESVEHFTLYENEKNFLQIYLPTRTAIILKRT